MKLPLIKAALLASCLGALNATAAPVLTVYSGNTSTDTFSFALTEESAVSIDYSWSDMRLVKGGNQIYIDANPLQWILSGSASLSGSLIDDASVNADSQGVLNLGNLGAGSYLLTLTGTWADVTKTGNGNDRFVQTAGMVNLFDGDPVGNQFETSSFNATPVLVSSPLVAAQAANVPEPQSYLMVLTGLGLIGATMRRTAARKIS